MNFKSDNIGPISAEIMQAILSANEGNQASYGADVYSIELQQRMSEVFETEVKVFLASTGTAANSLALSALVQPFESVYCSHEAHINIDECGAPEFYTGGAKLVLVDSLSYGKINPSDLEAKIQHSSALRPHVQKPGCISITQATECGTVYTIQELKAIHKIAAQYKLPIHMDGARFANSLVALGCKPADITWKVGVDVMSFGATKNGAMCAEAIVFFNHKLAENFDFLHKRAGQLVSKARFFSSQFLAYLKNDLWQENARKANYMAQKLAAIFNKYNLNLEYPVDSNQLLVTMDENCAAHLKSNNCQFYEWHTSRINSNLYRFVTSCYTTDAQILELDAALAHYM